MFVESAENLKSYLQLIFCFNRVESWWSQQSPLLSLFYDVLRGFSYMLEGSLNTKISLA